MSYEIKFVYFSGYNLAFTCFQPDGTGRGITNQPLLEVYPMGYYRATPLTDLVDGDMVAAYNLENLYWEDEQLVILTPEYLTYDGERLFWEEDWLIDYDTESYDILTWTSDAVGAGEYTSASQSLSSLIAGQSTVLNVYTLGGATHAVSASGSVGILGMEED